MKWTLLLPLCLIGAPAMAQAPAWRPIKPGMCDSRWAPSAVLLPGGLSALIAGGFSYDAGSCLATADVFDKNTNSFHRTKGNLTYPRDFAAANVLPDGTVLIIGGYNTSLGSLATGEMFDPKTEMFRLLPSRMSKPRELFTATTLADGRILCAGGFDTHSRRTLATADLYDPKTQTFALVPGLMIEDRFGQAAALLKDGRVLIAGGKHWFVGKPDKPSATAEIFDPTTNTFRRTKSPMAFARDRATATLLADGAVLIAGGQNGEAGPREAEIYDPVTDEFHTAPKLLGTPRMAHSTETLPDGRLLLIGGWSPPIHATTGAAEVFDPATDTFTPISSVPESSHDQALIVFPDGAALAAGGKRVEGGKESSLATAFLLKLPSNNP
ncbi:MAG: kelch repeat-containing protein [Capsulimonas sp.]|uniref:Kelch repeat-containing protein n=1 Tax=Capsulimonas sp. TaxID=2494211 RepID=UPI003265D35F